MLFIIVLSMVAMVIQAGDQLPDNCVLDLADFKGNVQGKNWINLFAWDSQNHGEPERLKQHTNYTMFPNDTLLVDINRWKVPDIACEYRLLSMPITTFGANQEKAEFQSTGTRLVRYASSRPADYIITNLCIDGTPCTKSITTVKVIDQRTDATCLSTGSRDVVLNNIPWDEINDDLKNCLGREFKDNLLPRLEWVWKGQTECPPRTPTTVTT